MGILRFISKSPTLEPSQLPSGSFTVDPSGALVASTLPQSFGPQKIKEITDLVLSVFRDAKEAQVPMNELIIDYSALRLRARDLRGGAIVFLSPRLLAKG